MKSEIIILYEPEQADIILSRFKQKELLKQDKLGIITTNYEVELALQKKGIPYHSIYNYLKSEIISNLKDESIRIVRQWLKVAEMDFFQYSGIKILETRGRQILTVYIGLILYYIAVLKLLSEHYNINRIYIPQSSKFVPPTAGPVTLFNTRIPVDVVMLFGKVKGISVSVLPSNKQQFNKRRVAYLRRQIVTFLFEQGLHISNFIITISRSPQKLKIFTIDHWRNIKAFMEKMDNIELVMMVRKEIRNMRWWEVWKKRARFYHPKSFLTSDIRKIARDKQIEFSSQWRRLGEKPRFSEIFTYQDIYFWPIVKSLLDYLIEKDSERVICEIEGIKRLLKYFSINRIVLRASSKDEFYLTAKIASQLKIPSVELQHGLIFKEYVFFWLPIKVDYFAAYGKLMKEMLNDDNSNGKVVEVGSPRFDRYLKNNKEKVNILRKRLGLSCSRPTILLNPPALFRDLTICSDFTSYEVVEVYQKIFELQKRIPELQIVIKLRPTQIGEQFHRAVIREVFSRGVIVAHYEDMKMLIELSDIVISPESTLIIEAMILKKPVILYTIKGDSLELQLFKKFDAIRIANTVEELLLSVRSLIFNKGERDKLIKNANLFLKRYFRFDGKSSDRIIELLSKGKSS